MIYGSYEMYLKVVCSRVSKECPWQLPQQWDVKHPSNEMQMAKSWRSKGDIAPAVALALLLLFVNASRTFLWFSSLFLMKKRNPERVLLRGHFDCSDCGMKGRWSCSLCPEAAWRGAARGGSRWSCGAAPRSSRDPPRSHLPPAPSVPPRGRESRTQDRHTNIQEK